MIRKFLIVGKHVHLSSTKEEDEQAASYTIDLSMPITVYWQLNSLLEKANFMTSSNDDTTDIQEIYRKVFKQSAPYAVIENDRLWLIKRSSN